MNESCKAVMTPGTNKQMASLACFLQTQIDLSGQPNTHMANHCLITIVGKLSEDAGKRFQESRYD